MIDDPPETPDANVTSRGLSSRLCTNNTELLRHRRKTAANAPLHAAMGEFDKIAKRAVSRVDAIIVGDIVPVVLAEKRASCWSIF
jgi:hypothetical protein